MRQTFSTMYSQSISKAQRIGHRPTWHAILFLLIGNLLKRAFHPGSPSTSLRRFLEVNSLYIPNESICHSIEIELLFVATAKDFMTLPQSISCAVNSMRNYGVKKVSVIVPSSDVEACLTLTSDISSDISVIDEKSIVSENLIRMLEIKFGERSGWILQQLLKLLFVIKADVSGVMVVDSDTFLLKARDWLLEDGTQILTPTWEFNQPYYRNLNALGISEIDPKFTFVSHHMMMQPYILQGIFTKIGWNNASDVVNYLVSAQNSVSTSEYSIDYELYAQYMMNFFPGKVSLEKWSNLFYNTSQYVDYTKICDKFKGNFASVSLHKYQS